MIGASVLMICLTLLVARWTVNSVPSFSIINVSLLVDLVFIFTFSSTFLFIFRQPPEEEPESLVESSSYSSESNTAEFSRCRLRLSASTGDLPRSAEHRAREDDFLLFSRSADDLRNKDIDLDSDRDQPSLAESRNSVTWKLSSSLGLDRLRLLSLDKEEIVRLWQSSERALLNRLQDTLREKRLLEQKLLFVQKTLLKPPWRKQQFAKRKQQKRKVFDSMTLRSFFY